jgi:hypothetical protein
MLLSYREHPSESVLREERDSMSEIAPLVVGSEKSSCIFRGWPSFHDAEVHEIQLECGHIDTKRRSTTLHV